ncbi:beta-L-arabinofuranosidase domain-containing protein [Bifidobacterium sp. ESL0800]|uniref:beta-L-arabinofuranosidase domain-containing protein n=1 Tax=Bifidobacterium sp. ESL0800 TaxID=2983236 RepID=UPI0023F80281|nr:beta-L-arabinofuranosidase domain-containing protein [Bifidobacterium sp. ESL0800]WEV75937.1 glycoside hydrolase family 127 protein [Bifidobacterium sp. ESL0800]
MMSEQERSDVKTHGGPSPSDDEQAVARDAQLIYIGNTGTVDFDLNLPVRGASGTSISWQTSDSRWIEPDGKVHMPDYGRGDRNVRLTATVTRGSASATREFTVKVLEKANDIKVKKVYPVKIKAQRGVKYYLPMFVAVLTEDGNTVSQRVNWDDGVDHVSDELGDKQYTGVIDGSEIKVTGTVSVGESDPVQVVDATPKLNAVDLSHVRLTGDGFLARNQRNRVAFLKTVDCDQLLYEFRKASGLDTKGADAMIGWDAPDSNLRGHTTGHYLSGYSLAYAATGEPEMKRKADYLVDGLAEVQDAFSKLPGFKPGFLSAYSEKQFDLLETYAPYPDIWAPYYTLHKILAGLLDAYHYTGNKTALDVASKVGDWVYDRLSRLPHEQLQNMWSMYIAGEFGGMNESMAKLYGVTGKKEHLEAARMFDNDRLMVPMREHIDALGGMHGNQHIPQVIGSVELYKQTGMSYYLDQAEFFFDSVLAHHAYAFGGVGQGEMFHQPDHIGSLLTENTAESCASYNLLKLATALEQYEPKASYGDYYEDTVVNHIAATTDKVPRGGSIYFFPTQPGGHKEFDEENSCCHGTGLESHFYYAQGAYYVGAREGSKSALSVRMYLNGTLDDAEDGLALKVALDDKHPEHVAIDVKHADYDQLWLRVPGWTRGKVRVTVDGKRLDEATVAGMLRNDGAELVLDAEALGRSGFDGASISLDFDPHFRVVPTPDKPEIAAVAWGPYVLAALSDKTDFLSLPVDSKDADAAFTREGDGLTFVHKATGTRFVPLEQLDQECYQMYMKVC